MINHVRTLFQNMPPGYESDAYIPSDFVPMDTPEVVQKIKRLLWGRTPASQLRIRQIMQTLHATVVCNDYVMSKDPRVTYLPFDNKYLGLVDVDLGHLMPILQTLLTDDDEKELFGDVTQEPNKTLFTLWTTSDHLPAKLGGLLAAVAECTERART